MKYRILSDEELAHLEDDFKQFLIVNEVHDDEWREMNKKDSEKALSLVRLFSDTVLQKVYEKVKFIEHRSSNACMVFRLGEDKMDLISIASSREETDLSTPESIHEALVRMPEKLQFFRSSKPYEKDREMEIHEMIEGGCVNSSEAFWILLEKAISNEPK
jgi:hypothetical protein